MPITSHSCENILKRSLIGPFAALALASPVWAHPGHGSTSGMTHYVAEPSHVLPLLASFVVSGILLAGCWFAIGRMNQTRANRSAVPIRVEESRPHRRSQ